MNFFRLFSTLLIAFGLLFPAQAKMHRVTPPKVEAMNVIIVRDNSAGCEPQCAEWIAAEGGITDATPAAFRRVFNMLGSRKLPILIVSNGGLVKAGFDIARMVRERGFEIVVAQTQVEGCADGLPKCKLDPNIEHRGTIVDRNAGCNSSCALLIAGGTKRHVPKYAFIGVHQISSYTSSTRVMRNFRVKYRLVNGKKQEISRELVSEKRGGTTIYSVDTPKSTYNTIQQFYASMGISASIMPLLEGTSPTSLHWLSRDELESTHISTDALHGDYVVLKASDAARIVAFKSGAGTQLPIAKLGTVGTQALLGTMPDKNLNVALEFWHKPDSETVDLLLTTFSDTDLVPLSPAEATIELPQKGATSERLSGKFNTRAGSKLEIPIHKFCRTDETKAAVLQVSGAPGGNINFAPVSVNFEKIKGIGAFVKAACKDLDKHPDPAALVSAPSTLQANVKSVMPPAFAPQVQQKAMAAVSFNSALGRDTMLHMDFMPSQQADAVEMVVSATTTSFNVPFWSALLTVKFPDGSLVDVADHAAEAQQSPMTIHVNKSAFCALAEHDSLVVGLGLRSSGHVFERVLHKGDFAALDQLLAELCSSKTPERAEPTKTAMPVTAAPLPQVQAQLDLGFLYKQRVSLDVSVVPVPGGQAFDVIAMPKMTGFVGDTTHYIAHFTFGSGIEHQAVNVNYLNKFAPLSTTISAEELCSMSANPHFEVKFGSTGGNTHIILNFEKSELSNVGSLMDRICSK